MQDNVNGKRVLVTGAASGIGAAIAARFTRAGALVAGLDLAPSQGLACSLRADLRSDAQLDAAFDSLAGGIGLPDIVVHAAALQVKGGVLDTDPQGYADVYDVNVIGAVRLMRRCVPPMRQAGGGAIVLLSSINASFATPTLAAYAASKAALENLAKTAALEFAPDRIRVNAIAPASIDTPMLRASYADSPAGVLEANQARHPLARFGSAAEVAELALFLASSNAAWITGAIYPIDGGASVTRR